MDSLHIMLAGQHDAQRTIGHEFSTMTDEERAGFISIMVLACEDELHEALGEVGWKPWATSRHINKEEYMGELTDAWLFLMNLMLAGGMTADDLIRLTAKKQDNLIRRVSKGYDGQTTKCPKCKRAYDNDGVKCTPEACGYPVTIPINPDNRCTSCGYAYIDVRCYPASSQGFGWCDTYSRVTERQVNA